MPERLININGSNEVQVQINATGDTTIYLPPEGGTLAYQGGVPGAIAAVGGTFSSGTVIFSNANNVSFGANAQTITASASFNQSNQNISLFALGNTTQNSSTVLNASNLSFNGLGIVTVGYSNGSIQISASSAQSVQTQNMVSVNGSTGNVSFANANNVTFGFNASTVTASASFPAQTNQNISLFALGNTTQNSSTLLNASNLSFNGLGNITVGYSNGSIQISGAGGGVQSNQTVGLYALGNTTQNSSTTMDARTLSFNGAGDITVGYSNGSIQISGSQSVQPQTNQNISMFALGNTTQNSSTLLNASNLSFNGLGIVTVGYSNGSIQVSASQSVQPQTNQNISLFALGNTTQNSSTLLNASNLSFNGLGDITVGYSNGSIQLSGSQTNQNISLFALGNTTQNSSSVRNASNLSFNGLGIITVGYSNGSIQLSATTAAQTNQNISLFALGNTTQNSSTLLNASNLSFNGLGDITVGYSNGSIQLSGSQTNQNISLFALGNTTQNSSSVRNASNLSFNGLGIITVGYSNGSIQLSATTAAQTNQNISLYALGNTTQNSSTLLNASNLSFNGLGIVTVGYSNGSIQVSASQSNQLLSVYGVNNTTNSSSHTIPSNLLSFAGLGGVSIGVSNGTIQISGVTAGGGVYTQNTYQNRQLGASTNSVPGQNSVWLVPMRLVMPVNAVTGLHMLSITGSVTSNQTNTVGYTWHGALYKVTGTNGSVFDTIFSTSFGFTFWNSGTASVSYSYNVTSGSSAGSNLMTASVYGLRQLTWSINSTLDTGLYAWGFRQSSSSAGNSSILRSFNAVMDNPMPIAHGFLGSATNASIGYNDGGTYSVTSASMPVSFNITQIRQTNNIMPYFKMGAL